jgi:uncharacterized membrane protein
MEPMKYSYLGPLIISSYLLGTYYYPNTRDLYLLGLIFISSYLLGTYYYPNTRDLYLLGLIFISSSLVHKLLE